MNTRSEVNWAAVTALLITVFIVFGGVSGCMYGWPKYKVWEQGLVGEAEFSRAEQNRRIKVQEAIALKESATLLAEADVERARGAARANEILGASLKDNEPYLRYLWIQGLQTNNMQVVYVPTEAGLPILEALRLKQPQQLRPGPTQ